MKPLNPAMFHGKQASPAVPATLRWVVHDIPGVVAIGGHQRGEPAQVSALQAAHLVGHKGFRYITAPVGAVDPDEPQETQQ